MEKWIGLLCANVFINTVFNFTLTFSLGANNLSHNVTLSVNKRVKEILTRSWYWRGDGEFASAVCTCSSQHQKVFKLLKVNLVASIAASRARHPLKT